MPSWPPGRRGDEREADAPAGPGRQVPGAVNGREAPTQGRRGDKEHAIGGIAVGVGDVEVQLDILERIAGRLVVQGQRPRECRAHQRDGLIDLELDRAASAVVVADGDELVDVGRQLGGRIAVPIGLAGQERVVRRGDQRVEHALIDEVRALTGGHLRGVVMPLVGVGDGTVPAARNSVASATVTVSGRVVSRAALWSAASIDPSGVSAISAIKSLSHCPSVVDWLVDNQSLLPKKSP